MAKKLIQVIYTVTDASLVKAEGTLKSNEAAANKADAAVKKYGKDAEAAGNQASKSFLNLGNVWKGLVAIGITAFIGNLAKKTFELGVKQEQLNIAFTTFLGSAERARKLLAELNKFALVTPFTPDQVNNAAKALLAFGVEGEKILPTLKLLGDVSAGTGKDLTEMAVIFGQIRSTGRLMGQDLLQLINAGFNPLQIISEKTGRSMKALKKDMEAGNISFEMVEQAFKDATSAGGLFFNLMEKQSQTVGGLLSTISGNIDEVLKNLFSQSQGPVKAFVDQLVLMTEGFLKLSESADQAFNREQTEEITRTQEEFTEYTKAFKDVQTAADSWIKTNEQTIDTLVKEQEQLDRNTESFMEEFNSRSDRLRVLRLEITAIQEYVTAQEKAAEDKKAKETAKALEEQAAAMEKVLKARKKIVEEIMKQPVRDPDDPEGIQLVAFGLPPDWAEKLDGIATEAQAQIAQQQADELDQLKKHNDDKLKEEEDSEKNRRAIRRTSFDMGVDLLEQLITADLDANDKLSKKEKDRILKQMALQGLLNSIRALGVPPVPNFARAGITAAYTAGQLIVAKAIGLKEGQVDIKGPGTQTSDSIPAWLSRGESVINAKATSQSRELLEAINEHKIDDRILAGIKLSSGGVTVHNDNKELVRAFRESQQDQYERGHFVYKKEKKGETLIQHIRSKSFSR